jgi:hypothetical protein
LPEGAHLAKPRGLADGQLTAGLADPARWKQLLADSERRADPAGLLVRIEHDGRVYGTVFAQLITSAPGRLEIEHTRSPHRPESFRAARWRADQLR